jgi:hypothetical protein
VVSPGVWADRAGRSEPTDGRGPEPAPLSDEPFSAAVDLLMKRAVPTLRFPNRKPRFPQAGLSLVRQLLPHSTGMSGGPRARTKPFSLPDENVLKQTPRY